MIWVRFTQSLKCLVYKFYPEWNNFLACFLGFIYNGFPCTGSIWHQSPSRIILHPPKGNSLFCLNSLNLKSIYPNRSFLHSDISSINIYHISSNSMILLLSTKSLNLAYSLVSNGILSADWIVVPPTFTAALPDCAITYAFGPSKFTHSLSTWLLPAPAFPNISKKSWSFLVCFAPHGLSGLWNFS
jgi:hypothetical protein